MHVAVGSTNPVKAAAVERALARFDPDVTPAAVDSGVAEQPRTVAETVDGARTRARRSLEAVDDATYGIGLEGGVAEYESAPGLFLIMWAGVTDGNRVELGGGPSLRLPEGIAGRIEAGGELGPALDDVLGTDGIAEDEGAAGVFSDGLTDRTRALSSAVVCAFGPFASAHYETDRSA